MYILNPQELHSSHYKTRKGLAGIFVLYIEVYTQFLVNRNPIGLNQLNKCAVRVLYIGKVAVGLSHLEVSASIADKIMSESLGAGSHTLHIADIKANLDEAWITPPSALEDLLRSSVVGLKQLNDAIAIQFRERTLERSCGGNQDATEYSVTSGKALQILELSSTVEEDFVIAQKSGIEIY